MNELIDIMKNRAAMYHFLARSYRIEVDESFLCELKTMSFPQGTGNEIVDSGYTMLHHYLSHTSEATIIELAVDYARVFLGSGALDATAAYPFESVYTSPHGLTMQTARDEVLALYRSFRLDKNASWREGEDHIALELEFMKVLCLRTEEVLQENNSEEAVRLLFAQYNFLQDHILNWAPLFFDDIPRYAKTEFYCAFALISNGFLEEEHILLKQILAEEKEEHSYNSESEVALSC